MCVYDSIESLECGQSGQQMEFFYMATAKQLNAVNRRESPLDTPIPTHRVSLTESSMKLGQESINMIPLQLEDEAKLQEDEQINPRKAK